MMTANHGIGQIRPQIASPRALAMPGCRRRQLSLSSVVMLIGASMMMTLSSGCWTQSIHPIYSDDTLVFDERLLGSFDTGDGVLTFTRAGSHSYAAEFADEDGTTTVMQAHLARINDALLLDFYLDEPSEGMNDLVAFQILPLHWILRVDDIGDSLRTTELDNDWMLAHLADFPGVIAHTIVDDRVILTDATERLQAFIGAHVRNADAWVEPDDLERLPISERQ